MKKTLTALLAISAVSVASAANINWSISGSATRVAYGVTATAADATSAANSTTALASTIYLLVADDASAFDALGGNETESAFLTKIGNLTANSAYSTSDGKKPSVDNVAITSGKIKTTAQTYGMLVYSTDSYGNGWYKIVTTAAVAGYNDGASADAQSKINPSWNGMSGGTWVKAWEAPTQPVTPDVPEPATGVLALAGVVLLFKRRRA